MWHDARLGGPKLRLRGPLPFLIRHTNRVVLLLVGVLARVDGRSGHQD